MLPARRGLGRAPVAAVALFAALLGALYATTLRDLVVQWWDDPNYSHGFLVPAFSAWLVWQRRERLRALAFEGSWIGLAVVAAGVAAFVVGDIAAEFFTTRVSLIVVIAGLVLFHLGRAAFRVLAFPIGFLILMVPLPAMALFAVSFPLQRLAANNAGAVLELLGVPVLLDGNVIQLTQITLGVTEACSGIRSLISLVALAVAWAYTAYQRPLAIVALTAAAVPITIAANATRIVATGIIGQWCGVEYASGFFHAFSGWLIFVFAVACLLALSGLVQVGTRLARRVASVRP